tara:strand:+ start:338 stop:685 length:348 start_codon:yes stop_codon:yes gene_type:complete
MGRVEWIMDDGTVCSASDEQMTPEQSLDKLRACRDGNLETFVDFFQSKPLLFNSLSDEEQGELGDYRQTLLDLPATVLAAVGEDTILLNLEDYFNEYAPQPEWFADKHPMGQVHS